MKFLTLMLAAVLTLAVSMPAEAVQTWNQKCKFKSQMLVGKLANCLAKADANVTKGKRVDTAADDEKCNAQYLKSWAKNREKALEKGADAEEDMSACEAATTDAMRDGAAAATLLAADRVLGTFGLDDSDLLAGGAIQEAVDAAVAGVDITSDNAALCTAAGGTYDSGSDSCSVDINTPTLSCTTRTVNFTAQWAQVNCLSGEILTGGGWRLSDGNNNGFNWNDAEGRPNGNGYLCSRNIGIGAGCTCYARCCKIQ